MRRIPTRVRRNIEPFSTPEQKPKHLSAEPTAIADISTQSTSAAPTIFDQNLLRQRKRRAFANARLPHARDGGFLRDHAARDVRERLDSVERTFAQALDLSDDDGEAARLLAQSPRVTNLTRLASDPEWADDGMSTAIGTQEALPVAGQSLNLITSVLGLQWANDLPGTLIQIRRSLQSDGLFLGTMIGGSTLNELRDVLAVEEEEATGGVSPKVAPFVDVRDLGSLLQRAGFALPVTDVDTLTVRYGNLFVLMADLRAMGATNALIARSRRPWTKGRAVRAAQIYAQRYADPDGRIRATFQLLSFSGWAPSENQQKPLRPGSAQTRLADALGVKERSSGDKAGPDA